MLILTENISAVLGRPKYIPRRTVKTCVVLFTTQYTSVRVFGPDTRTACSNYMQDKNGTCKL